MIPRTKKKHTHTQFTDERNFIRIEVKKLALNYR